MMPTDAARATDDRHFGWQVISLLLVLYVYANKIDRGSRCEGNRGAARATIIWFRHG